MEKNKTVLVVGTGASSTLEAIKHIDKSIDVVYVDETTERGIDIKKKTIDDNAMIIRNRPEISDEGVLSVHKSGREKRRERRKEKRKYKY